MQYPSPSQTPRITLSCQQSFSQPLINATLSVNNGSKTDSCLQLVAASTRACQPEHHQGAIRSSPALWPPQLRSAGPAGPRGTKSISPSQPTEQWAGWGRKISSSALLESSICFFSNVNTSSAQQFQRKGLAVNTLLRSLRTETRPWSLVNFKWFYTYKRLRQCHNDLWFYNSSNKVTRTRGLFLTVLHQSKCNSMPS